MNQPSPGKSLSFKMRNKSASANSPKKAAAVALPKINNNVPGLSRSVDNFFVDYPERRRNPADRLSGLLDPENTTGLLSEHNQISEMSSSCVRCGEHASICMPCSDQLAEQSLIFYKKTRAAGAASLFTNAFLEAGNSKLVKFLVFRLLKNSFETRNKQRMKMNTVVERLFGANLVFMPFAAWKRYTKENILNRKDKRIKKLEDQIKMMEGQMNKMSSHADSFEQIIKQFKQDATKRDNMITAQQAEMKMLRSVIVKERERVVGLAGMAKALETYVTLSNRIMQHSAAHVREYLQDASTNIASYNYNYIFDTNVLKDLLDVYEKKVVVPDSEEPGSAPNTDEEAAQYAVRENQHRSMNREMFVQLLLDWVTKTSRGADKHIEETTGRSLGSFLPKPDNLYMLEDLKSGRDIMRVVVCLIFDAVNARKESLIVEQAEGLVKSPIKAYSVIPLHLEELHLVKQTAKATTFDLISYALLIAHNYLGIPLFRTTEIFNGVSQAMESLVISLMVCSTPIIHGKEHSEIMQQVNTYTDLSILMQKTNEHLEEGTRSLTDISQARSEHTGELLVIPNWVNFAGRDHEQLDIDSEYRASKVDSYHVLAGDFVTDDTSPKAMSPKTPKTSSVATTREKAAREKRKEETYEALATTVDEFIKRRKAHELFVTARNNFGIAQQLASLTDSNIAIRARRDTGIGLANDIRQFAFGSYMEYSLGSTNMIETAPQILNKSRNLLAGKGRRPKSGSCKIITPKSGGDTAPSAPPPLHQEETRAIAASSAVAAVAAAVADRADAKSEGELPPVGEDSVSVDIGTQHAEELINRPPAIRIVSEDALAGLYTGSSVV